MAQLADTPALEPSKVPDLQLNADRSSHQNEGEHNDRGSVTEWPSTSPKLPRMGPKCVTFFILDLRRTLYLTCMIHYSPKDRMKFDDDNDDDEERFSDTSSSLTEIGSQEFPSFFVERDHRLFPSHGDSSYPFPVDGHEQNVSVFRSGSRPPAPPPPLFHHSSTHPTYVNHVAAN